MAEGRGRSPCTPASWNSRPSFVVAFQGSLSQALSFQNSNPKVGVLRQVTPNGVRESRASSPMLLTHFPDEEVEAVPGADQQAPG